MLKVFYTSIVVAMLLPIVAHSKSATYITVEEARISKASQVNSAMVNKFAPLINEFEHALTKSDSGITTKLLVVQHGKKLFRHAVEVAQSSSSYDDRPLYWARLQMAKLIRSVNSFRQLTSQEQEAIMFAFELASRGVDQSTFSHNTDKKILITGFDPFFLDRNIEQSNPSGIAALMLDNKVINFNGQTSEVQALIVPVRFADFDQGMIETMLTPHIDEVDMIATISMGREQFDLERFPGLRRSAKAPGNLNVYTGASAQKPLTPFLKGDLLNGPEFVEFSLPVEAMQQAKGKYQIIDNRKIETLKRGKFEAKNLSELTTSTSVNGSGGGYLSNEISYRSILMRNEHNPDLPVGHIHTPRISKWHQPEVKEIVEQIQEMLRHAISAI